MSNRYQLSVTYTFAYLKDGDAVPYNPVCTSSLPATASIAELRQKSTCVFNQVTFPVANDLGGEYGLATSDERHRAVFNGIWDAGHGFSVSGLYFYGSGARFSTTAGGDRRNLGASGQSRLRADNTIVERNSFVGNPLHRVDARVTRAFTLGGRRRIEGMIDIFNLFNHKNYGSYTLAESSPAYGTPTRVNQIAYSARTVQLGFRVAF
jgi:hypothetical protein